MFQAGWEDEQHRLNQARRHKKGTPLPWELGGAGLQGVVGPMGMEQEYDAPEDATARGAEEGEEEDSGHSVTHAP